VQGLNRATNAFLKYALGQDRYQAWLLGVMEMPKVGGCCSLGGRQLILHVWRLGKWAGSEGLVHNLQRVRHPGMFWGKAQA